MVSTTIQLSTSLSFEEFLSSFSSPLCIQVEDSLFDISVPFLLQLQYNSKCQIDICSDAHEDVDRKSTLVPIPHDVSRVEDAIGCPWLLHHHPHGHKFITTTPSSCLFIFGPFTIPGGSIHSLLSGRRHNELRSWKIPRHYTTGFQMQIVKAMRLVGSLEPLGSQLILLAHELVTLGFILCWRIWSRVS